MSIKPIFAAALLGVGATQAAMAVTVPFTETFSAGSAGWLDAASAPASAVATGGADGGGYITVTTNVADSLGFGGQTLFRCNDSANCSGDAFVGNWEASVHALTLAVRHNAAQSLEFFARIATPFNFPAWAVDSSTLVAPNTWTLVSFLIDPANPLLTPEFGTFSQTFGNVGNFQIGVSVPAGFTANDVTFDLDRVSVAPVPLPGAALFAMSGILSLLGFRRRV